MTNEIAQYEEKWIILMKSGLIHWVTKETGERASEHLANQSGHSFIRIKELNNITINSAEVEGVYDHAKYAELCRVKSGEWQCSYGKWHLKKGECQCKKEWQAEEERKRRKKEEEENSKPVSPEEQEKSRKAMSMMSETSALDGSQMFRSMYSKGNSRGRKISKEAIAEWEKKNGRKADLAGLAIEEEGGGITNNEDQHDNA